MIKIKLDDQSYEGEAALGTTLGDFLAAQGLQAPEVVFEENGRPRATAYTLIHSVNGTVFTAQGEIGEAVVALTVDEVVTARV